MWRSKWSGEIDSRAAACALVTHNANGRDFYADRRRWHQRRCDRSGDEIGRRSVLRRFLLFKLADQLRVGLRHVASRRYGPLPAFKLAHAPRLPLVGKSWGSEWPPEAVSSGNPSGAVAQSAQCLSGFSSYSRSWPC